MSFKFQILMRMSQSSFGDHFDSGDSFCEAPVGRLLTAPEVKKILAVVLLFSLVFIGTNVYSEPTQDACALALSTDDDSYEVFLKSFHQALNDGDDKFENDLQFTWSREYWPTAPRRRDDGKRFPVYQRKSSKSIGRNNDSENPLVHINKPGGRHQFDYFDGQIARRAYRNYEGRVLDRIIDIVRQIDKELPEFHVSQAMIKIGQDQDCERCSGMPIATIRLFNGTGSRAMLFEQPTPELLDLALPFMRFMKIVGASTKTGERISREQKENPGQQFFEIGKLNLQGPVDMRHRSLKLIEMYLLKFYAEYMPKAEFIVHVATPAHLRHYRTRYGLEVIEEIEVTGLEAGQVHKHYIMSTTGEKLAERLRKLHDLPDPEMEFSNFYSTYLGI